MELAIVAPSVDYVLRYPLQNRPILLAYYTFPLLYVLNKSSKAAAGLRGKRSAFKGRVAIEEKRCR